MSRDDLARVDGIVMAALGGGNYSIDLTNGVRITASRSGRLRRAHIKVLPGDPVTVGISPYDTAHGLIMARRRLGT
jgi:translation initiation factor IF-1